MSMTLSSDDKAIVDEVSNLASRLWGISQNVVGLNTSVEMHSVMLFRRLWNNHRGFLVLWKSNLQAEAAIILRSGLEAAICLAANSVLRDQFVTLVRQDAAETMKRQIKMWHDKGEHAMARDYEAAMQTILKSLPSGVTPKVLDWRALAHAGGVPYLYFQYRFLSGGISHITGLSLIRGVVGEDMTGKDEQEALYAFDRDSHLMMMAGTTLQGCKIHAATINAATLEATSDSLIQHLNETSDRWFASTPCT